ncbi:hypothetical protein D9M69_615590 [compost metagenome]
MMGLLIAAVLLVVMIPGGAKGEAIRASSRVASSPLLALQVCKCRFLRMQYQKGAILGRWCRRPRVLHGLALRVQALR